MARPASELALLGTRRFAPLFVTNLLGVLNDNLFKTGLLMMASYGLYRAEPARAALLASEATGVFIAPFFLFSATAGQVADRFDRTRLVRLVKSAEVAIMALGLVGFATQSIGVLLCALFLMGVHSTFYTPLKYAILPQQLEPRELLGGTGVMEAGGFIAIITGQLLAGVAPPLLAGGLACTLAVVGLAASFAIPSCPPAAERAPIEANVVAVSWRLVRAAAAISPVWLSILGIAWFFAVGAVLLSELIPLVKDQLHAAQQVAVLFLSLFSLGIAAGSLLVNRLLKGEVSARYTPVSGLLLAGLLVDLAFASTGVHARGAVLGVTGFLALAGAWRIVFDLSALAVCGGVFVIPLYAVLQAHSPQASRARILAANNIVNAGVSVAVIGLSAGLLKLGLGVPELVGLLGLATGAVAVAAALVSPRAQARLRAMRPRQAATS